MNTREVTLSAVIAAAYAALTLLLAPISYYQVQVRVADALLALTLLFGWPSIIGVTVGCFIANILGPFGLIDAIGGSIANLVATIIGWKLRKNKILSLVSMAVVVSAIVSSYLYALFNVPYLVTFVYILIGSLISIAGLGYLLLKALERTAKTESFETAVYPAS